MCETRCSGICTTGSCTKCSFATRSSTACGRSWTGCGGAGAASSLAGGRLRPHASAVDKRWIGATARAVLFLGFVWYVYSARFAPYREFPFDDVETTVLAANAGFAFALLDPSNDGTTPAIKRMSEVYGDYGIHLIVSLTGSAGRTLFGSSFQLRTQVARVIVFLLLVVTAAAIMAAPV